MSEERQNNTDWTSRLNELDAIPDESANDHSASWEKLHARLDNKKNKIVPFWYWMAAACIISLFFIPFIVNHKNETGLVKEVIKKDNNKYDKRDNKQAVIPDSIIYSAPAIIAATKEKKMNNNKKLIYLPKNKSVNKAEVAADIPEIVSLQNEPQDTGSIISPVIVSAPKKLRIIHINELTHPVGEQQIMVKTNYRENFSRMQLSNNATDNILKINLSPTN